MLEYHYIWNIPSSECWDGVYLDVYLAGIPLLKAVGTRKETENYQLENEIAQTLNIYTYLREKINIKRNLSIQNHN